MPASKGMIIAIIIILVLLISSSIGAGLYFTQNGDCKGTWSNACNVTSNTYTDTYTIKTDKGWFGKDCPFKDKTVVKTRSCGTTVGPSANCTGRWDPTTTCVNGYYQDTFYVITPESGTGTCTYRGGSRPSTRPCSTTGPTTTTFTAAEVAANTAMTDRNTANQRQRIEAAAAQTPQQSAAAVMPAAAASLANPSLGDIDSLTHAIQQQQLPAPADPPAHQLTLQEAQAAVDAADAVVKKAQQDARNAPLAFWGSSAAVTAYNQATENWQAARRALAEVQARNNIVASTITGGGATTPTSSAGGTSSATPASFDILHAG